MQELEAEETRRQAALFGKEIPKEELWIDGYCRLARHNAPAVASNVAPLEPEITIDDFAKVDLRVGLVKSPSR